MSFFGRFNPFDFPKLVDRINITVRNFLLLKFHNKKRETLRNSNLSDKLFKKIFGSQEITEIRNVFYNNHLFPYSNNNEREKIIECLNHSCLEDIKKYLNIADKIIELEFHIFEKIHLFKDGVDWHYGFFDNFSWKLQKSETINIHPKGKNVDVKYVWELNRHQFLLHLGFAYYYTKNEKYAKEFKYIILDWIKKNPPLYGINWYSGLEISIRLISWIFTLYFFGDSKEINNNLFFKKIVNSMIQHAYHLKYFYTRRSFNHTVGELFGIYLFSRVFKKLKPFKKWDKIFFKKFKSQLFLQIRPDGTNIEQSINYHRFVLEFFSLFTILNFNTLKKAELNIIEKMYDYLLYSIKPNGAHPSIGDIDDGKVLILTSFKKNLFEDLINLGSTLLQRGDLKSISRKIFPPSILLLGVKGNEIYNNLTIIEPEQNLKYFDKAGYFFLRNNWSDRANYLFVDFGKFGAKEAPHSHSSITNIIYSYKGKNILIDSGCYTYNKSWKERNDFRNSKAHNILSINGQNQAVISSWFSWVKKPKIRRTNKFFNNKIELECVHNGFSGFIVKRNIKTEKNLNRILIKDVVRPCYEIQDDEISKIKIYYHLNNGLNISLENNTVNIDNELLIKVSSSNGFNIQIEKSFYSPNYGEKYENSLISISSNHSFKQNKTYKILTEINPI